MKVMTISVSPIGTNCYLLCDDKTDHCGIIDPGGEPARIIAAVDKAGGVALITADHGNADEMYEIDKKTGKPKTDKEGHYKAKTSHTLNPVPCILYNNVCDKITLKEDKGTFGLSDVAATMVNLMGYEAPSMWDESLLKID